MDLVALLLNLIADLLRFIFVGLAQVAMTVATWLFDTVMSPAFNNLPLTHGFVVDAGWVLMRDFANMFFIAAFIVMAVGTMLGVDKYNWRKILPRFIVAALLVNFTKLFAGVVVDVANIIILFFIQNGIETADPNRGIATQLSDVMQLAKLFSSDQFLNESLGLSKVDAALGNIVSVFIQAAVLWSAAITMGLLAITMIIRIIRIWLLVILSPLVVVASILPDLQKHIGAWFQNFFKWTFVGVSITAVVYLAALLAQALIMGSDLGGYLDALATIQGGGRPDLSVVTSSNFIGQATPILMYLMLIGLLNYGRGMAATSAGAAGGALVALAGKAQGAIHGTALKYTRKGGGLAYRAGMGRALQWKWVKSANRRIEDVGASKIPGFNRLASGLAGHFEGIKKAEDKDIKNLLKDLKERGKRDKDGAQRMAEIYIKRGNDKQKVAGAQYLDEKKKLSGEHVGAASAALDRYGKRNDIKSIPSILKGLVKIGPSAGADEIKSYEDSIKRLLEFVHSDLEKATNLSDTELAKPEIIAAVGIGGVKQILKRGKGGGDHKQKQSLIQGVELLKGIKTDSQQAKSIMTALGIKDPEEFKKMVKEMDDLANKPSYAAWRIGGDFSSESEKEESEKGEKEKA